MVVVGNKIIHIVEGAGDNGTDTILLGSVPEKFNLSVNGLPLIPDIEFQILPEGFKLLNGLLYNGNRCVIEPYEISANAYFGNTGNVRQYPHILMVKSKLPATLDSDGNWSVETETVKNYQCRAEPSSGRGSIAGDDGNRIYYDWVIYMPIPAEDLNTGSIVTVRDGLKILSENKILRFSRGQLNARVWL